MPTGIYKRTQKHRKATREGQLKSSKAQKAFRESAQKLHKLPRTEKQLYNSAKMGKLPKTSLQIETTRKMGLSNHGDMIVKHHNDLCHGAERPDDVAEMTLSQHSKLHAEYRARDNNARFANNEV